MKTIHILFAVGLSACAPSLTQVREARDARYAADYAEVWAAVRDVVAAHYGQPKQADEGTGILVTEWKLITRKAEGQVRGTVSQDGLAHGGEYFQARILIVPGGPPWRIVVQGEGAEHKRDFSMLVPYKRNHEEEPAWVQGRIDKLQLQIHERLEKRAAGSLVARSATP
jgi:uncharacterized lipoprotein